MHIRNNEAFATADKLPDVLLDAKQNSAWQEAYGSSSNFWDWLDEKIPGHDGALTPRPERAVWATGMWGYGLEKFKAFSIPYGKLGHPSDGYVQLTDVR